MSLLVVPMRGVYAAPTHRASAVIQLAQWYCAELSVLDGDAARLLTSFRQLPGLSTPRV